MPRVPSSKLRLGRIIGENLKRIEDRLMDDPTATLTEEESRTIKNLAQADEIIQRRVPSKEEQEEEASAEEKLRLNEEKAKDLTRKLTEQLRQKPGAPLAPVEADE